MYRLLSNVMQKKLIHTRLDSEDVDKIDALIKKKEFDNRSSFVRKSVVNYLKEFDHKILA